MKKKYFCFSVLQMAILGVVSSFVPYEKLEAFEAEIPVTFSPSGIPIVNMEIEDQTYLVKFDLGLGLDCQINKRNLQQITKQEDGFERWRGINGVIHKSNKFLIEKVFLENVVFTDLRIVEIQPKSESVGVVGRRSFKEKTCGFFGREALLNYNIFLDFPNDKFIIYDNKDCFNKDNYFEVPFILDSQGILFQVDTDFGFRTFALDTGATKNIIKKKFIKHLNWRRYVRGRIETDEFSIAGNNFGKTNLYALNINCFKNFDGILGMDFLKDHRVHIDFQDKLLYFEKPQNV